MNILNLPIAQQKKIAARCGMTHAEWVADMQASLARINEFQTKHPVRRVIAIKDASPYQQFIQKRMDAENPAQ